ncbi:MAG: dihydrolipoyl dehydrogenase [Thermoproteus sp.]|jgi:dihydrolipoamide dehydrogenase
MELGKYPVYPPTDPDFLREPKRDRYDVVIIGAGGGGYHGAFELSKGGMSVLMVDDKGNLGGSCLYEGCIPSKSVRAGIHLLHTLKEVLSSVGNNDVEKVKLAWENLIDHKDWVQDVRYIQHIREVKEHPGLELVKGIAAVVDEHRVRIRGDGWTKEVEARWLHIATGSVPIKLPVPGAELAIGSMELFGYKTKYRRLPKSAVIIGGGYIGVEVAFMLARMGVKATIVEMLPRILSGWSDEVVSHVERSLRKLGVDVLTGSKVVAVKQDGGEKIVEFESQNGKGYVKGEEVVMAVGRRPFVDGLDALGIVERGRVAVDSTMRTKRPNVYAAGDVIGQYMLFHAAVKESTVAAWNILHGHPVYEVNFNAIPITLFSEPEAAMVGLNEETAKARGISYATVRYPLEDDAHAQIYRAREGYVKLIIERESQRIIGGEVVGEAASLLINEVALAVAVNARVKDLALLAHAHPTIFEAIDRGAVRFKL